MSDWWKIKGIFTQIAPIHDALKLVARQCDQDLISINFASANSTSNENLDQLPQSFMYTQILKEILLKINYDEQSSVNDLAAYCREQHGGNGSELVKIDKFEREYNPKSAIWWYTVESCIYSMLNRALRNQEIDTILKMGFFIRDLHRHIEKLHSEQFGNKQGDSLTVYRGQHMSKVDFEKMMATKGGLMSFNNFLSTSKKREVSMTFAKHAVCDPEMVRVLFEMIIDKSASQAPFALVDEVSFYKGEQEILFSTHTVFRINDINQIDNDKQLWKADIKLTADNDNELNALTKRMREETQGTTGRDRMGRLLLKLGEINKAELIYRELLDLSSDDSEKSIFYRRLGLVKNKQGEYEEAVSFYKWSLEIMEKSSSQNSPDLAQTYNDIGEVYSKMERFFQSLSFHEKALEIKKNSLPPDHPDLAKSYNDIGVVYSKIGRCVQALSSYETALEIRQKSLPQNHPDLAESHSNIGVVYSKIGEYSKALLSHETALEIKRKSLPPNHPDLATSYSNIGSVYSKMKDYSKALLCYEQALDIRRRNLPPNHPSLKTIERKINLVKKKS